MTEGAIDAVFLGVSQALFMGLCFLISIYLLQEQQKRQLKQHIRMMQEKLESIDKTLAEKKGKKK